MSFNKIKNIGTEDKKGINEYNEYMKRGMKYLQDKNYLNAVGSFREAISINPRSEEAYIHLGDALFNIGKYDSALKAYSIVMQLNPTRYDLYYKAGLTLYYLRRYREAEKLLKDFISFNKKSEDAYNCLYLIYRDLGDNEKGEVILREGIAEIPGSAKLHNNLANILQCQGRFDEAIKEYNIAIKLCNDFAEAVLGKSLIYLLNGNFKNGWEGYESRLKLPFFKSVMYKYKKPIWDGRPLADKKLMIWTEQGYGDAIQFIRFVKLINKQYGRIILNCQRKLIKLFQHVRGIDVIYDKDVNHNEDYDFHIPIMSLGRIFVSDEQSIPDSVPYIDIPLKDIDRVRREIGFNRRFLNVGIVWGGNIKYKSDKNRSIDLSHFLRLSKMNKIKLYSLQKGEYAKQLSKVPDNKIINLDEIIDDFYDTALIIKNLDLIVSVDTAVAHLAGALGKSVWLLIPKYPDWRWMLDRDDSPWYPTMRIFRQKKQGNWDDVFRDIELRLLKKRVEVNDN